MEETWNSIKDKKSAKELGIHLDDLYYDGFINDVYIPEDIIST